MQNKRNVLVQFIIQTLRNFFIIAGVIVILFTLAPVLLPQISYYWGNLINKEYVLNSNKLDPSANEEVSFFGEMLLSNKPVRIDPPDKDFSIVIEKIGISAPIVANVSMTDKQEYKNALENGVAHAKGSDAPGDGSTYLFAHSSLDFWELGKYATVFNLLGKLENGDRIVLFYNGNQYDFYVKNKYTLKGWDTSLFYKETDQPSLFLQTCTPPGTIWNRLIIEAILN